jgi:ribosomal protein S18 acetylase RimI-like enzyme
MLEEYKEHIPERNIFMYCEEINKKAFSQITQEYFFRNLNKSELEIWKSLPFNDEYTEVYKKFMNDYWNKIYKPRESEFFNKCIVVCNENNEIIGTCLLWKMDEKINTIHWLKVKNEHEGKGIGRALITKVLEKVNEDDFPLFLHTQPESYRAIKLYSDFGFKIVKNSKIGSRENDFEKSKEYMKKNIPEKYFGELKFSSVPNEYLTLIEENGINDF